jgi:hypothetical protein
MTAKGGVVMTRRARSWYARSRLALLVSIAAAVLAALQLFVAPGTGLAASRATASAHARTSHITLVGELDCNGYNPVQRPVKPGGTICAEVHLAGHLEDNGYNIGHDEPTIQFYSRRRRRQRNHAQPDLLGQRVPAGGKLHLGIRQDNGRVRDAIGRNSFQQGHLTSLARIPTGGSGRRVVRRGLP